METRHKAQTLADALQLMLVIKKRREEARSAADAATNAEHNLGSFNTAHGTAFRLDGDDAVIPVVLTTPVGPALVEESRCVVCGTTDKVQVTRLGLRCAAHYSVPSP